MERKFTRIMGNFKEMIPSLQRMKLLKSLNSKLSDTFL